ncbi:MAG: hypothetical protein C0505_00435 [Leptothrix sp. (in: Bacteria)]|nr:hypothetical protein [Leptothrix sp. (in: b-proteobacteria)]
MGRLRAQPAVARRPAVTRAPGGRTPMRQWAAALSAVLATSLCCVDAAAAGADPVAVDELLRNARMWQSLGRADNQRLLLDKLLAIDAGQPTALLMLGELELLDGRPAEARRLLARLPQGSAEAAELQELLRLYTRDFNRLQQLRLLRRGGNQARAAALARQLFPQGRAPGGLGAEFAGLLGGRGAAVDAAARQAAGSAVRPPGAKPPHQGVPPPPPPTPPASPPTAAPDAAPPADNYWPLLAEARARYDAGRLAEAAERAAAAAALQPAEPEGALLRADIEARLGRSAAAETAWRALADDAAVGRRALSRLLAALLASGHVDIALSEAAARRAGEALDAGVLRQAADVQVAAGRPEVAQRWLAAAVGLRPADAWLRHDLARVHARLGQPALAREVLADGLASAPTRAARAEMRYAAALAYAAMDADADALATLAAVPETERTEGQRELALRLRQAQTDRAAAAQAQARRQRDAAEARRQPTEEAALFPYQRRAADGRSSLRGVELPIVITRPTDAAGGTGAAGDGAEAGHRWWHADRVRLNAGALPLELAEASRFGRVLATGNDLAAPLPQAARGLTLGTGWTGARRRWDLGVVGLGFQVPNLVGGWRQDITLAGQDASVELSRRVLTGSLLSYAGTRDPVSGQRWGGVTLNAATLRVARDVGGFATSASVRAGWLGGRNVAANSTVQLRLAADRDWLDTPALRLNAGPTLALWHYRRNLGFYTFGQGGYYSPQRYTSLGLPITASGRAGAWSYRVRASLARSWTYEADTPYYPTDGALQAATGTPLHDGGGRGGGTSTSVRAEVERRLAPHWSAGAVFNADRSAYYAPTQWLFYLRRSFKPQGGDLPLPRPVQPYAQF